MIGDPEGWKLDKMGQWVSPLEVVRGGGRFLHAVQSGARVEDEDGTVSFAFESLDAPLVAPGLPRLLHADDVQPQLAYGMHVPCTTTYGGRTSRCGMKRMPRFRFVLRF